MKLPLFNSTYRGFTKRDTLGLQSLSSSIQAKICPIVNVVTPHPFYWAFLIWNYYHFYSLQENKEVSDIVFNKDFVKRNDFFFVLSNHLGNGDTKGIVGRDNVAARFPDKNADGVFNYDETYYSSHFGGMQYYNYGCYALGFVKENKNKININDDSSGAKLTRAFDSAIKNTSIYKKYISQNKRMDGVCRDDLLELSRCLTLNMKSMDEVKDLLYYAMFQSKTQSNLPTRLSSAEEYIRLLISNGLLNKNDSFDKAFARKLLYGDSRPKLFDVAKTTEYEKIIATRWELVIANQYYVACMEMVWKYLLSVLTIPCSQDEWIEKAISNSDKIDLLSPLPLNNSELTFDELESNISSRTNNTGAINSMIAVLMSIYRRFDSRLSDFNYLDGLEKNEDRVFSLIIKIHNGEFKTVGDFVNYILKNQIIDRHERVAKEKRYQGRDGFLFEKYDNLYTSRGSEYTIDVALPPLRITNVFSVLKDLGKI